MGVGHSRYRLFCGGDTAYRDKQSSCVGFILGRRCTGSHHPTDLRELFFMCHEPDDYDEEPTVDENAGYFVIRLGILLSIPLWGVIILGIIMEVTGNGR